MDRWIGHHHHRHCQHDHHHGDGRFDVRPLATMDKCLCGQAAFAQSATPKTIFNENILCFVHKPALFCPLSIGQTSRSKTHSLLTSATIKMLFLYFHRHSSSIFIDSDLNLKALDVVITNHSKQMKNSNSNLMVKARLGPSKMVFLSFCKALLACMVMISVSRYCLGTCGLPHLHLRTCVSTVN